MTFGADTRRRLLVLAVLAALWLLGSAYLVGAHPGLADRIDHGLGEGLAAFADAHAPVERGARVVASLTRFPPMLLYALLVAGFLWWKGFRRPAVWLVAVLFLAATTTFVLKAAFDRPRPDYAHMQLRDAGFPSGHATDAAAAAWIAVVLAVLFVRRSGQRRWVAALAALFALLIGLDRLLLGVHGVTDVLAGYAVATLCVCGAAYVVDPSPRPPPVEPLPSPVPRSRQLAVILNPTKVEDPAVFRTLVNARAEELGWSPPVWFETTVGDPGRSMAHEAAVGGAALVVVCGGDGTVRTVCGELAGTGVPVGVIPMGTGNLLARNLNLPLYLNAALDVALSGQDRAIDVVRVSGDHLGPDEHFLVMTGMGFDAAIMEGANDQVKARFGWLAYVLSGLRNMMFPAIRVDISVDGQPSTRHRARTIVVGNVGFLQAGLPLLPDASIDDGRIDVVLVNPRRFRHWVVVLVRVMRRTRKLDDTVNRMTGRTVLIRAGHPAPRQIDGDPVGAGHELACECLPGRLLVRVPR